MTTTLTVHCTWTRIHPPHQWNAPYRQKAQCPGTPAPPVEPDLDAAQCEPEEW